MNSSCVLISLWNSVILGLVLIKLKRDFILILLLLFKKLYCLEYLLIYLLIISKLNISIFLYLNVDLNIFN